VFLSCIPRQRPQSDEPVEPAGALGWQPADPPRPPVLFVNPKSGGEKAARAAVAERARERGIDVSVLRPDRGDRCVHRRRRAADRHGGGNGRLFLNNVSLGIYGDAVGQPGYRDAKARTLLETAREVVGPSASLPGLRLIDDLGREHRSPAIVLV
jgi:hypothetical protein